MKSRTGVRLIPNEADACFSVERTALLRLWAVYLQKGLISTPSRRPGSACWRAFHRSVPAGCCGEKGILFFVQFHAARIPCCVRREGHVEERPQPALPQRHPGKRRRSDGRLKPRSGPPRERSLLAMLTRKADGSIFAIPGPGLNHPQLQSLVPKRGNRDVFRDERIRTLQKGAGQIRFGDKNLPVSGKECPDLRVCGRREAPDDDEIHGRVLTGSSCPGPYTCPPAPPPGPFRFPRRAAPAATPAGCRRR